MDHLSLSQVISWIIVGLSAIAFFLAKSVINSQNGRLTKIEETAAHKDELNKIEARSVNIESNYNVKFDKVNEKLDKIFDLVNKFDKQLALQVQFCGDHQGEYDKLVGKIDKLKSNNG